MIVFPPCRSQQGCSVRQSYAGLAGAAHDALAGRAVVMSWRAAARRDTDSATPGLTFMSRRLVFGRDARPKLG